LLWDPNIHYLYYSYNWTARGDRKPQILGYWKELPDGTKRDFYENDALE
jgi:hypothetical protein